jgi:hypothetical protein
MLACFGVGSSLFLEAAPKMRVAQRFYSVATLDGKPLKKVTVTQLLGIKI